MSTQNKKRKRRPGKVSAEFEFLLKGLGMLPSGLTTVMLAGMLYPLSDLKALLERYKALFDAVEETARAHAKALEALDASYDDATKLLQNTRATIKPMLGKNSPDLVDYGIKPDKVPEPLTADQQVIKVERCKATRKARGTLGPRQRAAIKGVVS